MQQMHFQQIEMIDWLRSNYLHHPEEGNQIVIKISHKGNVCHCF
jgi:hypothetical protein